MLTRQDVNFFQRLEMLLRTSVPLLIGRDHLSFRSAFSPTKHIVDGSLILHFHFLPMEQKENIATDLETTPMLISKRIEEIRLMYAL